MSVNGLRLGISVVFGVRFKLSFIEKAIAKAALNDAGRACSFSFGILMRDIL